MSRVREEGAGGGFERVAAAGRSSGAVRPRRACIMGIGPAFRGRSGAGLGETLEADPHAGLGPRAGRVTPSPLRSYAPAVTEMSAADDAHVLLRSPLRVSAERLARFGDGLSRTRGEARPTGPLCRHWYGTKGGVLCFPIGRCEGTLGSAPFRRLAELVGFGNRGMRDCATPNSTALLLGERAQICCLSEPID